MSQRGRKVGEELKLNEDFVIRREGCTNIGDNIIYQVSVYKNGEKVRTLDMSYMEYNNLSLSKICDKYQLRNM